MRKIKGKDIGLFLGQVMLMSLIVLSPGLISYLTTSSTQQMWSALLVSSYWLVPATLVYLLNFYLLVPLIWSRQHYWQFCLSNLVLVFLLNAHILIKDVGSMPESQLAGYISFATVSLLLNLMAIGVALSIRYVMRQNEKRQKNIEAELTWLKSQINPHFLFNTLNNISSLTQIDADEAQDAVMQLSDLLRYAMYETNKPKVPIGGEIDFMRNYIELMKLRCNEKTQVDCQFTVTNPQQEIAPLLFISLVENAFKHGVNSNEQATIDIRLTQEDNQVVFVCDNTNNPKPNRDRSGSGIGLDNTRRRLDLLYRGHYQWEQTVTSENIYHVKVTIQI